MTETMHGAWRVAHHQAVASTNDEAAVLRDAGAMHRVAVVADEQTHGRGREGRTFASPTGGLYVSLLLQVPRAQIPHVVVAGAAVAVCEAIESVAPVTSAIKWPNDLWIGERKVGGILLEASGWDRPVTVGIGVNLQAVPDDLPDDVRMRVTSLADEVGTAPNRDALLYALLDAIDRRMERWPKAETASAWRQRLVWIGRRVSLTHAGAQRTGVLEDVDLVRGLLVRDETGSVWLEAAHVQDLTVFG